MGQFQKISLDRKVFLLLQITLMACSDILRAQSFFINFFVEQAEEMHSGPGKYGGYGFKYKATLTLLPGNEIHAWCNIHQEQEEEDWTGEVLLKFPHLNPTHDNLPFYTFKITLKEIKQLSAKLL